MSKKTAHKPDLKKGRTSNPQQMDFAAILAHMPSLEWAANTPICHCPDGQCTCPPIEVDETKLYNIPIDDALITTALDLTTVPWRQAMTTLKNLASESQTEIHLERFPKVKSDIRNLKNALKWNGVVKIGKKTITKDKL